MTSNGRDGRADVPIDIRDALTAVEFAELLSELRRASGRSLRNLSEAIEAASDNGEFAHASYSTLGEWCRGDRLPQLTHLLAFERLLEELGVSDTEPWLEALSRVRQRSTRGGEDLAPYKGLNSFFAKDREWFFGRSELTMEVVDRIRRTANGSGPRLIWVVGASGSGKSSLLHAGVVPTLQDEGWTCDSMTPGPDPAERLAATSAPGSGNPTVGNAHLSLLLVDAFEELFTQVENLEERDRFVRRLVELSERRTVICAVRIDLFAEVADLPILGRTLADAQILVRPMRVDELREAIEEPAAKAGGSVDEDLVEVLVRELVPADGHTEYAPPGALPLVSFALSETWRLRRRGRMTLTDYFHAGGLGGAVQAAAEEAYGALDPEHHELVRHVFLRLVHVTATTETRRHVAFAELAGLDPRVPTPELVIRVVDPFIDSRLLTIDDQTIRLTHEAVLSAWPRLQEWIDVDRAALAQHRTITAATNHWLELDKDRSALAAGRRLAAMSELAEASTNRVRLSRDEQEFLDASEARTRDQNEARKRRQRLLRAATGVAACFAVVAGVLAIVANRSRSDAVDARQDALSRQIAITAEGLVGRDPSLAQQLAVVAYDVAPTAEARAALLDLGALPNASRYLGGAGATAVAIAPSGDWFALTNNLDATVQLFSRTDEGGYERAGVLALGDPGVEVYALAATPDEDVLVVGDTTTAVTLWDVSDLDEPVELASFEGPNGPVQKVAISPDGTELVAVGATELWQTDHPDDPEPVDAVIRWDISDPANPRSLPALPIATEVTWSVAYSPDGSLLVVGDEEGRMSVWTTGADPEMLSHTQVGTRSTVTVAISGDDTVAAGNRTAELTVWDISDPATPVEIEITPPEFSTWVNSASFSPDGTRFVAGGSDTLLQVWDTSTWEHVAALPHPDPITQTAFSDEGVLITGAVDGTARLWDVARELPERLTGIVGDSSFSADGTRAAGVSGWDAGIWDTSTGRLDRSIHIPGDDLSIGSGSISPDGTMLAYGTIDGLVRLHDLTDPEAPAVDLPNGTGTGTVQSAYFSADNQVLAAGGNDTNVRIWDLSDRANPDLTATIEVATQIVLQVGWSPTGRTLTISSGEGKVYLYDVDDPTDPKPLSTIDVFDSEAYTAEFTPDGTTLAIAGTESDVWVFDIADPTDPQLLGDPLTGPNSRIYDLTFDGTGSQLAAASTDGTVWIWNTEDVSSPDHVATLGPREDSMFTVSFHPTENRLLGSGIDPTVLYWDLDVDRVIDEICRRAGDIITEDEWMTYLPSEPYSPPCTDR